MIPTVGTRLVRRRGNDSGVPRLTPAGWSVRCQACCQIRSNPKASKFSQTYGFGSLGLYPKG